ncbi:hypothetical protein E4U36_006412 [Claviceps purpurea]|nr:hypothetical protein E4U36_006412 [Claviceps purpurea]
MRPERLTVARHDSPWRRTGYSSRFHGNQPRQCTGYLDWMVSGKEPTSHRLRTIRQLLGNIETLRSFSTPDPILIVPVLDGNLTPAFQVTGNLSPLQTLSGDPVKNPVTFLPGDWYVVENQMRIEDLAHRDQHEYSTV